MTDDNAVSPGTIEDDFNALWNHPDMQRRREFQAVVRTRQRWHRRQDRREERERAGHKPPRSQGR